MYGVEHLEQGYACFACCCGWSKVHSIEGSGLICRGLATRKAVQPPAFQTVVGLWKDCAVLGFFTISRRANALFGRPARISQNAESSHHD